MRKGIVASAATAALTLVLAACSGGSGSPSASGEANGEPDPDATVSVGFLLEPTGLDPQTTAGAAVDQVLLDNVYEGLTTVDEKGEVHPKLATSWDVSNDARTYTFHLRDGVKFHDGSAFDAPDVVASLNAAAGEKSLNPDKKRLGSLENVEEVDAHTVKITLSEPDSTFLTTLGSRGGVMLPSDNKVVDLSKKDNGTGPFTLGEWKTGTSIELDRFDSYWGDAAKAKKIIYRYFKDQSTAANALTSGQIDIFTQFNADLLHRFQNDPNITTTEGSDLAWLTVAYNGNNPALKDPRVRAALREGVNKPELLKSLNSALEPIGSMANSADPWWDKSLQDIHSYNPDHARQLLKEAGQENLTLNLRVPNVYDPAISEYIRSQLAEIGVKVNIEQMEFATWLSQVYQGGNFDMTMVLHTDPWTISYYANPNYYWHYNNAEVQQATEAAIRSTSVEERNKNFNKVAHLISEDSASDWIYSPKAVTFSAKNVKGFPTSRTTARYPAYNIEVVR